MPYFVVLSFVCGVVLKQVLHGWWRWLRFCSCCAEGGDVGGVCVGLFFSCASFEIPNDES